MADVKATPFAQGDDALSFTEGREEFESFMKRLLPLLETLEQHALISISGLDTLDARYESEATEAIASWQALRTTHRTMRILYYFAEHWHGWAVCATTPGGVDRDLMDAWTYRHAEHFEPEFGR